MAVLHRPQLGQVSGDSFAAHDKGIVEPTNSEERGN